MYKGGVSILWYLLVAVDKVEALITHVRGRLVITLPILCSPVLGDFGALCVNGFEVESLEDEE